MTSTDHVYLGKVAAALAALRTLLIAGHVALRDVWEPGHRQIVEVVIDDQPAARDALIEAMTDVETPREYAGEYFCYREWRGTLFTMQVSVVDRLRPVHAAAVEHDHAAAGQPRREPAVQAAHLAGWTRGIGRGREAATDPANDPVWAHRDGHPLLELLAERFGPAAAGPAAPIEVTAEAAQRLAGEAARGVVVIPGADGDPEIAAAYARYARGRAAHYFGTRRFPTVEAAREAIGYWPGHDMLTPDDVEAIAGSLVDPPRVPEPAPGREPGLGRRLLARVRTEAVR